MVASWLRDRLGDLLAAVPRVHAPQSGHAVQNLASVVRPVVHALCAFEQARIGFELPIGGERHPERFEISAGRSGRHVRFQEQRRCPHDKKIGHRPQFAPKKPRDSVLSVDYSKQRLNPGIIMTIDVGSHLKVCSLDVRPFAARTGKARRGYERNDFADRAESGEPFDQLAQEGARWHSDVTRRIFHARSAKRPTGVLRKGRAGGHRCWRHFELSSGRSQAPERASSIMHERYARGRDTGEDMLSHKGEEGGLVLRGKIELTVGGQRRVPSVPAMRTTSSARCRIGSATGGRRAKSSAPARLLHSEMFF